MKQPLVYVAAPGRVVEARLIREVGKDRLEVRVPGTHRNRYEVERTDVFFTSAECAARAHAMDLAGTTVELPQ